MSKNNNNTPGTSPGSQSQPLAGKYRPLQSLVNYLLAMVPLVLLFGLFMAFFKMAEWSELVLPITTQYFMFMFLFMMAMGVFITKVLQEEYKIKIHGYALSGILAVMFVLSYFITDHVPAIARAVGIPYSDVVIPGGGPEITLTKVRLTCTALANSKKELPTMPTQKLYMYIDGATSVVDFIKSELSKIQNDHRIEIIEPSSEEGKFFGKMFAKSGRPSWISYTVPYASNEAYVPIPTRIDTGHTTAVFINPVDIENSEIGSDDYLYQTDQNSKLIEVAKIAIEPHFAVKKEKSQAKEGEKDQIKTKSGSTASTNQKGHISLVLNLHSGHERCWSPSAI